MPTALPDNDKELSNVPGPMGEDGDLKIHEESIDTVAKEFLFTLKFFDFKNSNKTQ